MLRRSFESCGSCHGFFGGGGEELKQMKKTGLQIPLHRNICKSSLFYSQKSRASFSTHPSPLPRTPKKNINSLRCNSLPLVNQSPTIQENINFPPNPGLIRYISRIEVFPLSASFNNRYPENAEAQQDKNKGIHISNEPPSPKKFH